MSQAPCTAVGEVPRERGELDAHHQQVAEFPLALRDAHLLAVLRFEAVLPTLRVESQTFSLSESACL